MQDLFACKSKRWRTRAGFTLLELLVVVCIVAIMAGMLVNRLQRYQKMAEKAAVEQTVGILRSALHLRFAALIAKDRAADAQYFIGQNPMNWLAEKPANYAGEYFDQMPDEDVSGHWYFDLKERNLVYFVRNHAGIRGDDGSLPQLRFKTKLVLSAGDFPVTGKQIDGKEIEGVVLEQIVPYAWN